jgi:hypothetical protein
MLKEGGSEAELRRARLNKEVDSVASVITGIKAELRKNGLDVHRLLEMQKHLDERAMANGSEVAMSFLKRKPRNQLQALFANVRELKIGSFGKNIPGSTDPSDAFVRGAHITFISNNIPITIGYGGSNDLRSYKDAGFENSIYAAPKNISYVSTELRRGALGHVKISFIGSFNQGSGSNSYTAPSSASNNVALTINRMFNLGKFGKAEVDISKSTTFFNRNYQFGAETIIEQRAGIDNSYAGGFFEAFAFGFNHQLDVEKYNLSENVYFNYSGLGYQNPGNNGNGGARKKIGGNLRKSLYGNKLILNFRTDMTQRGISYTSNDQWRNYQFQVDTRYKINPKFNVSLKYNVNGTDKRVDNITSAVYSFQKTQFDGNASYKIGKHVSVSHLTAGLQMFSNKAVANSAGNLLMLNYTQSIVLRKNTLSASFFFNKELSAYRLLGDMLNSDLSYQYSLFGKLNLSTAATYLSNTGIAKQFGLRQGLQVFAGNHFDMSTYVDLRKNLIPPLYPDLYANCRAELSLKYHFTN